MERISQCEWVARTERHRARAERWTGPARRRRGCREAHPVEDFLFQYYPFPIGLLERWHPGVGVAVEWGPKDHPPVAPLADRFHRMTDGFVFSDPALLAAKERVRMEWTVELLEATAGRTPNFGCHGLHEWAMVYRGREVRHESTLRLRLSQPEIDAVVETRPIACSHFDAFRFFAGAARNFNRLQPTLDGRVAMEQPGCVHANMDLYKWAAKSMPWVGSDLLLDSFELAMELRRLDMRASPYDVSQYGLTPVRIETAEGRRQYEDEQRELATRAAGIRARLIEVIRATLAWPVNPQTPCQPSFCRSA